MLSAGEASGDQHAASLFLELRKLVPELRGIGMGGTKMREAGVDIRYDSTGIAVIGATEVIKHYGEIRRALKLMQNLARDEKPDLLICVDYKEFNFQLAKAARAAGIKVLFYVSPQVWAWRPGRVKKYGRAVDHMAVIFPFEVPFYEAHGIPVTFVGHPLAGRVRPSIAKDEALQEFGLAGEGPVIGLLPGSRGNEIKRLLPVILEAVQKLADRFPKARFVLSQAPSVDDRLLHGLLQSCPLPIRTVKGRQYDVLQCCGAVVTVSGTATLEVALSGVPMTIIYKVTPVTYQLGRRLIKIPFIGLPNILAGKSIVREFIQHEANADNIAGEIGRILADPEYAGQMREDLRAVADRLGEGGGSARLARLAADMMGGGKP
ncbi:lipid-A-disaccharide synthase [Methylococcus sp. EFPC2]|uniref:lipid-A-disaccharide synthase n=1 Tax=Methylococcus sp. EFPC2 TaxID=2812648 RepID=UPI001967DB00|nr:lipid-A-disaccharide synthase [Methylococcus sp. EFPC2]QSA97159.1 lipid-A-disaccharide synthase [Methylococcus sp. EFPC2]